MTTANSMDFGETWVYESIISALPGIEIPNTLAIGIQLVFFETAVLVFAALDDNATIAIVGSAAVLLATLGSVEMLRISRLVRSRSVPTIYKRLLFGSKVETVLGVLVYVALVTHLFVFEPRQSAQSILHSLLGPNPPVVVMYVLLLVGWDISYRIGTNWWASLLGLWRAGRYRFSGAGPREFNLDPETARLLRRADSETALFGLLQLSIVPVLESGSVLQNVLIAHVIAVVAVSGAAAILMTPNSP
ncbi:hypothetical protein [Haloquadratum walsbyi]|uniref:Uncharacterized protein n=1 Tax=Haloquadratum walsbyi J07HQW2 TaxID=1238425 RepID=U1NIN9_9EURY|nr:hypothetical protein [Haloquadratum walsbyi]ERG97085.1 MAG: hypothetical protein J07HQW2_03571 [Haloquadratum walsbyi J07HQW2]